VLDLSFNSLFGQLPSLDLQELDTLYLNGNSLEGSLPDALTNCSKLRILDLNSNQLSGPIPPKVGSLTNLEYLDLSFNNGISGIIPPTLANLTRLSYCNLQVNKLEGSIPVGIWQLSNMVFLSLGNNSLSGEIPQAINLSALEILGLEANKFGKALPSDFGDAFPSLQNLYLDNNRFKGQIPWSLGNASLLGHIDLSVNNFTGQVPASLGKLTNLNSLNLETNMLEAGDRQSWGFLDALANCRSLTNLSLYDNRLGGDIPDSVGNLSTMLQSLSLGANKLTGTVPSSIGNLHNLIRLALGENSLSGEIGEWVGKLKNLQGLFLEGNMFTGLIPSSISNLTQLTLLLLQRNEFQGVMPASIEKLSSLSVLDVSYNNLHGDIPLGVGNLKELFELHLSSNNLTGKIPDSLAQCQNLVTIQMDQNILTGEIPKSFGKLESLTILNLSHNNLSGSIVFLNNLPQINKLDLSYNNFQGEIPRNGVFANPSVVSLGGNKALCGGVAGLHMPSCRTVSHTTERQYYLVKVLIPIFGFMSLVLLVYFLLLVKKTTSRRKYISLTPFGQDFLKVSYNDLAQATRNFSESNLVGRGSYGSVYRGKLKEHKLEVAVKVFNLEMQGAERSFMSECEALRSIQHRNLLPIITACSTVDNNGDVFKALIYEFMPNGNLDTWLHHSGEGEVPKKRLSLTQRISIAVNIADALDYLHFDCGRPTVHCDLKPSNILLDDDMTALLGDFGIARFYADSSSETCSVTTIGLRGTIGYIAPEYGGGGHASTSGDVSSFGILLLEMLTGKRPTDPCFKDGLDIVNFAESNFPHQIFHIIDPHLADECKDLSQQKVVLEHSVNQCLASMLKVGLSCTRALPSERMDMKQIATKMHEIKNASLVWKTKCAS